jgi:hypothetical protein
MHSKPDDLKERASTIGSEFFGCVAGSHEACISQLKAASWAIPYAVWLNLCLEPLFYGLSVFGEFARQRYGESERETFVAELDRTIRWLFINVVFEPIAAGFGPYPPSETFRLVERAAGQVAIDERKLTKEQENALAVFSARREVRQRQFELRLARRFDRFRARLHLGLARCLEWSESRHRLPPKMQLDADWLLAAMKQGWREEGLQYSCPESPQVREFAERIVIETHRIRAELFRGDNRKDQALPD